MQGLRHSYIVRSLGASLARIKATCNWYMYYCSNDPFSMPCNRGNTVAMTPFPSQVFRHSPRQIEGSAPDAPHCSCRKCLGSTAACICGHTEDLGYCGKAERGNIQPEVRGHGRKPLLSPHPVTGPTIPQLAFCGAYFIHISDARRFVVDVMFCFLLPRCVHSFLFYISLIYRAIRSIV